MRAILVLLLVAAPALADDMGAAREHYRKGTSAYEVGDFDEAIREFAAAYKLRNDPAILYNLGQSHRLAGHLDEALRSYRMYLSRLPDAPNRVDVERLVAEIQTGGVRVEDSDTIVARKHFRVGAEHYGAGRYQDAIREFEIGRALRPSPGFDFNIGRSYDRLDQLEQALAAYQRYVSATPTPNDADAVRKRMEILRVRLAPPAAVAKGPDRVREAAGRRKLIAGLAVGAVGIAGVVLGITFAALAANDNDKLSHPAPGVRFDPALEDRWKRDQALEASFFAVGGAALVAGTVVAVLGRREQKSARVAFIPSVGAGRLGAALQVGF